MSISNISGSAKEDLVVSLAILALHDGGSAVSADNINAIVRASGNSVAPYWGALYSKVLAGRNIDDMLLKPGAGGGSAPAAGASSNNSAAGGVAAAVKEEEKKEGANVVFYFLQDPHSVNSLCIICLSSFMCA